MAKSHYGAAAIGRVYREAVKYNVRVRADAAEGGRATPARLCHDSLIHCPSSSILLPPPPS